MKNNIKKIIADALVMSMTCLALVGCGKQVTVESLFEESKAAYSKEINSMEMGMSMVLKAALGDEETSMSIGLDIDMDMQMEMKKGMHMAGDMEIELLGFTQKEELDSYIVYNEDESTTYTYDAELDAWEKEIEAKEENSEEDFNLAECDFSKIYEDLTLAKELVKDGDKEFYQVSGTIKFDELVDALEIEDTDMLEDSDVDLEALEGLEAKVDFFFAKENSLLSKIVLDMSGADLGSMMSENDFGGMMGEDATATLEEFVISLEIKGIDNYTFELPEEVEENSFEAEDIIDYSGYEF